MRYELTNDDVELIVKALSELTKGGLYSDAAKNLAIEQRVKQLRWKLGMDE